MKRSKIFFFAILTLVLAAGLSSCSKKKADGKAASGPVTLVMAEVNPENSICGRMDAAFKQEVEELSGGTIHVEVFYSGTLGDEAQVMKLLTEKDNTVQLARMSANLSSYGSKKSGLLSIPYTFKSSDHFWKFARSDLAREILLEPYEENIGVRGLCYGEEGFRNFFSVSKISSLKDLEGQKLRVSGSTLQSLAECLNTVPVNVNYTDLYMALQTGAVEVAEQPLSNYLTNSFYDVAPYMIFDHHMLGVVQILISSSTWDSLSKQQQEIIQNAADYASKYCHVISDEEETDAALQLMAEGVEFTDVSDLDEWKKACSSMITAASVEYPELYGKIVRLGD